MDTVYVETTVVGSIAGRLHPDTIIASRQLVTRKWWQTAQERYALFVSQLVTDECSDGDYDAAQERLAVILDIELLDISAAVESLADALISKNAVPSSQARDALHIAIAAANSVQYIVTWNFKHIANPTLQKKIAMVCQEGGFEPPVICTPEQLMEAENDSKSN